MGQPSSIFKRYIVKYPDSIIAKDYREYGSVMGHFAEALYSGDFDAFTQRADFQNRGRLRSLGVVGEGW